VTATAVDGRERNIVRQVFGVEILMAGDAADLGMHRPAKLARIDVQRLRRAGVGGQGGVVMAHEAGLILLGGLVLGHDWSTSEAEEQEDDRDHPGHCDCLGQKPIQFEVSPCPSHPWRRHSALLMQGLVLSMRAGAGFV
jgi:hypothetical protein